jgi:hypothetical protein
MYQRAVLLWPTNLRSLPAADAVAVVCASLAAWLSLSSTMKFSFRRGRFSIRVVIAPPKAAESNQSQLAAGEAASPQVTGADHGRPRQLPHGPDQEMAPCQGMSGGPVEPPHHAGQTPAGGQIPVAGTRGEDAAVVNFWNTLSDSQRQALDSVAQHRTFAVGATLMREGEEADHVIVILKGWTKICVSDNGTERVIAERGPGQLIGERAAFQVNVRSATVIALDTVKALVLTTDDFADFVTAHPDVLRIIEGQVYDRLTQGHIGTGDAHRQHAYADDPVDRPTQGRTASDPRTRRTQQPLNGENCTVVRTDVVGFSASRRNDEDRRIIKQAIFDMTRAALEGVWPQCHWEDRGDGLLIVVPSTIPTAKVIKDLHTALPTALRKHNRIYGATVRIQLRLAIDVGPVVSDGVGMSGESIVVATRLVDAPVLKEAIKDRRANLGVIVSRYVYESAIKHADDPMDSAGYRQVRVAVNESTVPAWMRLIDGHRSAR